MRVYRYTSLKYLSTLALGLSLLSSCGADQEDTSETAIVQFDEVKDDILLRSCTFSGCHAEGVGQLFIEDSGLYEALVNVPASVEGEVLVRPFDADGSYLIMKMEGAVGIEGVVMPPNAALSQETIDIIRNWIDAGAER